MGMRSIAVYNVIWYAAFGAVIYFVNIMTVDILMLIFAGMLTFAGYRMASSLRSEGPEVYKAYLGLAFFQTVLAIIVLLVFLYTKK